MSSIFGETKLNQTPGSDDVQSLDIAESLIQAACGRRAKVGFESGARIWGWPVISNYPEGTAGADFPFIPSSTSLANNSANGTIF